jgi:hypothetical protein
MNQVTPADVAQGQQAVKKVRQQGKPGDIFSQAIQGLRDVAQQGAQGIVTGTQTLTPQQQVGAQGIVTGTQTLTPQQQVGANLGGIAGEKNLQSVQTTLPGGGTAYQLGKPAYGTQGQPATTANSTSTGASAAAEMGAPAASPATAAIVPVTNMGAERDNDGQTPAGPINYNGLSSAAGGDLNAGPPPSPPNPPNFWDTILSAAKVTGDSIPGILSKVLEGIGNGAMIAQGQPSITQTRKMMQQQRDLQTQQLQNQKDLQQMQQNFGQQQAALNRKLQQDIQAAQLQFEKDQNQANRDNAIRMAKMNYDIASQQLQGQQALETMMLQSRFGIAGRPTIPAGEQ